MSKKGFQRYEAAFWRYCRPLAHYRVRFLVSLDGKKQLFRGVEEVVRGVRHAEYLADMRSVAARRWRFATFGVDAPDGGGAREHTLAIVAEDVDQKPWNGIGVGRWHNGDCFAGNTAAVKYILLSLPSPSEPSPEAERDRIIRDAYENGSYATIGVQMLQYEAKKRANDEPVSYRARWPRS